MELLRNFPHLITKYYRGDKKPPTQKTIYDSFEN